MNFARFGQQLAAVRERAEWLRAQAGAGAQRQAGWLAEAIGELTGAIDELQQAEENVRLEMEDLRRSRAAVETERERYRSLFEFAPDGYLITTLDGLIQEANWAAGILLNTPEEALVGRPLLQFVVPDEAQSFRAAMGSLSQVDGAREWETRLQPRDYASFQASVTVAPERLAGRLVALRWLMRDITARQQAAEQIQALNAALEQRVQERTAQLQAANAQLQAEMEERQRAEAEIRALNTGLEQRVAERTTELEAKNRELETFTYSVSHDLKAPLRGIDGYTRLLLEAHAGRLDAEAEDSLRTIRRAVLQMNQLIDDLLAYARLERRSLLPGRVDLLELVEEVVAERRPELERRGVTLTVDVPCRLVSADRDGLSQAIRNLLDNALKFTHGRPEPRLEIGGEDAGAHCRLWVRDNGIGFDMRYADRIFGLFQRLHRAEDYDGTGIGLAIVHKAMQRMHGRAWAESAPGQGACFYLEIPR